MQKIFLILCLISVIFAGKEGKRLIWSDEFDGGSLDRNKWTFDLGSLYDGWGNNELEYYTDRTDNVYVSDGMLHIRAKKENMGGKQYTSARIKTLGKFSFQYGYVEARMKVPASNGIWPAFWMMGANIDQVNWPKCGEIDIMEAINKEYKVYATNHWDENGHAMYGNNSGQFDITQFHTYSLEWNKDLIQVFVDGNKFQEMIITNNKGGTEEFHKPFFFLLNVAVGGNWPGFNIDQSAFPQELVVDYIRVYQ